MKFNLLNQKNDNIINTSSDNIVFVDVYNMI